MKELLQILIAGIGDYLMRVVGSVPMGLYITLETDNGKGETVSCYYNKNCV
jgi:hypothetical protein